MNYPLTHYFVRALTTLTCAYAGYLVSVLAGGPIKLTYPASMLKITLMVATGCSPFGTAFVIEGVLCCLLVIFKDVSSYWFVIPALFLGSLQLVIMGIWTSGISWWGLFRLYVFVAPFLGLLPLWFLCVAR
jgi:hypothetical protein